MVKNKNVQLALFWCSCTSLILRNVILLTSDNSKIKSTLEFLHCHIFIAVFSSSNLVSYILWALKYIVSFMC